MSRPAWLVEYYHTDEKQHLLGVKIDDIISINDGDVCNASVTQILLDRYDEPICVDVGGDVGWWSAFCLKHSKTAKLYTFEPNPKSFQSLKNRFKDESRIQLFERAVSDIECDLFFSFDGPQSNSREGGTERVKTITLDFIPKINILKIDTEGHEVSILNGLSKRFHSIDSIIFEFTPYWYASNKVDSMHKCFDMLMTVFESYPYIYVLSRRGMPNLTIIDNKDAIIQHIVNGHDNHVQSDIVCSRMPIYL